MRADAFLAAARRLPLVSIGEILGKRGVVVVAPHPDDESLGCGALIAEATLMGLPVRVVVVSDGVGSHPGSLQYPAPRLRALREAEALAATAELGLSPTEITFLGLPDRAVPASGPEASAAADRIGTIARRIDAGTLLVTWRHDPHSDHQAAHSIAKLALANLPGVRLASFPIWAWRLPANHDLGDIQPSGVQFDGSPHRKAKRAAILAHRSQASRLIDDDPGGFLMDPAMIERFVELPEIYLDDR